MRGDVLVCYVTRLSRWVGLLEVVEGPFEDSTPIFTEKDDPFVVRFKVKPLVWLPPEEGIPIHAEEVWSRLSFTREHSADSSTWTGSVRTSLVKLDKEDAKLLEDLLRAQAEKPKSYPLDAADLRALQPHRVRREGGTVTVSVPDDRAEEAVVPSPQPEARESIKVQALLAQTGARMGFRIWVPAPDRAAVLKESPDVAPALLETLPLDYDTTTLRTIENIDVLWLKGQSETIGELHKERRPRVAPPGLLSRVDADGAEGASRRRRGTSSERSARPWTSPRY